VFVELKHREVPIVQPKPSSSSMISSMPSQPLAAALEDDEIVADGKKKKKDKKDKEKSSKKDKEKHHHKEADGKKNTSTISEDLLNFDWMAPSTSSAPTASASNASFDLLSGSYAMMPADHLTATAAHAKKDKPKSSSKKSSSSSIWFPLVDDSRADVFYAFGKPSSSAAGTSISISFRAAVRVEATKSCSVDLIMSNVMPIFRFANGSSSQQLSIGANIRPGDEALSSVDLVFDPMTFTNTTVLGAAIRLNESTVNAPIKVYLHTSFTPTAIDPVGFAGVVSKSSNRLGNATARVAFNGKAKSAMKSIASFLRCHIVEEEYSRAVSLFARTPTSGEICCLVKAAKEADFVTVEIKALCGSRSESTTVAESMALALSDLKL
jgi:hypothetical protein